MSNQDNNLKDFKISSVPTDRNLSQVVRESWEHTPLLKRISYSLLILVSGYSLTRGLMLSSDIKKDLAESITAYKTDTASLERARNLISQAQNYDYIAYGAGILTAAGFLYLCYGVYKTLRHPRDSDFFG